MSIIETYPNIHLSENQKVVSQYEQAARQIKSRDPDLLSSLTAKLAVCFGVAAVKCKADQSLIKDCDPSQLIRYKAVVFVMDAAARNVRFTMDRHFTEHVNLASRRYSVTLAPTSARPQGSEQETEPAAAVPTPPATRSALRRRKPISMPDPISHQVNSLDELPYAVLDIVWRNPGWHCGQISACIVGEIYTPKLIDGVVRVLEEQGLVRFPTTGFNKANSRPIERVYPLYERSGWYYKGQLMTVADLHRSEDNVHNIWPSPLMARLKKGWSVERSLSTPASDNRSKSKNESDSAVGEQLLSSSCAVAEQSFSSSSAVA